MLTGFPIHRSVCDVDILNRCPRGMSDDTAGPSVLIACLIACNRCPCNPKILNAGVTDLAKRGSICSTCDRKILQLKEVAVELSRKIRTRTGNRRQRIARKVNIILEHVVLRKIVVDIMKICCVSNKLIVVVCRRCISTIDRVGRRRRHRSVLIADMGITAVCCIGVEDTIRRRHIRRIEETNMSTVYLDRRRRDLAHIHNIGLQCSGVDERCSAAARKVRLIQRRLLLRRDMKMPDVDLCALAEDDAVRIDDIDVVAADDLAVDVRGVCARDDVQIVVRLCTTIMNNTLNTAQGVVSPFNHIVCVSGVDVRIISGTRNSRPTTHDVLARWRGKSDLWNQKSARHACDEGIAYPLR